jgi:hypothetical protein
MEFLSEMEPSLVEGGFPFAKEKDKSKECDDMDDKKPSGFEKFAKKKESEEGEDKKDDTFKFSKKK